jgi:predicted RNA polymerase sigma factor
LIPVLHHCLAGPHLLARNRRRDEIALQQYPRLPSVRTDLLARLGVTAKIEVAATPAGNERERELMMARAAALADRD